MKGISALLACLRISGRFIGPADHASQDSFEGRRRGSRLYTSRRRDQQARETFRFSRQESSCGGILSGRVHRWLNEGNHRVPVWYRKVQRYGCSSFSNQYRFSGRLWRTGRRNSTLAYPLLSDHMRKVSEVYGVLIPEMGIANRVTFIVDTDGKIVDIQEGKEALDPTGAETACSG